MTEFLLLLAAIFLIVMVAGALGDYIITPWRRR